MPLRLYRRTRIAPGLRLNLSRSGPSLSIGGRGAHYTIGRRRRRATVGVPGTGVFYTAYSHHHARAVAVARRPPPPRSAVAPATPTIRELFHRSPGAKIGYGIVLTAFLITAPVGVPLLLTGIVQLFSRRWRARGLIARAARAGSPEAARTLLDRAGDLLPADPEVTAPLAAWHANQGDHATAAELYAGYLAAAPGDDHARAQYARSLLLSGRADTALAQLARLRELPLDDESRASITAGMALAELMKGDAPQALALVREAPLRRHQLGDGLQQCLHMRAAAHCLLGQTPSAIADLERLYAVNPLFPDVPAERAAMERGTFTLATPAGQIGPQGLMPPPGPPPSPPSAINGVGANDAAEHLVAAIPVAAADPKPADQRHDGGTP